MEGTVQCFNIYLLNIIAIAFSCEFQGAGRDKWFTYSIYSEKRLPQLSAASETPQNKRALQRSFE